MIKIFEPFLGEEEKKELSRCIDANWITGGPKVKEFEDEIALLTGADYAVSCMNGTIALYMSLVAMELDKSEYFEVIVPDFTFIASANAVVLAGGRPVFCDVKRETGNIDLESAKKCLTVWTKAIMPVHIYGQSANMDQVLAFAETHHIKVIEDAAQGVGVYWKGKAVGTFGEVGIHSYYADKTISTGEGGMVLTNNKEIANRCIRLKHQGRAGRGWYIHEEIGYNFRMTDLQGAVGLAQLRKLDNIIQIKKDHEEIYREKLKIDQVKFLENNKFSSTVPFRHNILVKNPTKLSKYLKENGIETKPFFSPLHLQPCYNDNHIGNGGTYKRYPNNFPNSVWLNMHGLSLPSSVSLTLNEIHYVCKTIVNYFKENSDENISDNPNT
jgi:perosamine synthetase